MKRKRNSKEVESSIQGFLASRLIAYATADHALGQKIRSGELRKKLKEPKWKVPALFELEKISMGNFEMEFLTRKEKPRTDYVILQLHGGGYVEKMRNIYRTFAGVYSEMGKGMSVLSIDYRVAPEYPYPGALEDAIEAFDWLVEQGFLEEQIILAGDSAGGGLALALCLYLRDQRGKMPAGIITMSPWTDLTASGSSYEENFTKDPLFGNTKESLLYNSPYLGENDPRNPYISPVFGEYRDFPPMLIQVGSIEMLLSDSMEVARKAREEGVQVQLTVYEGMFHLFQMALKLLPESQTAWKEIGEFLDEITTSSE